MTSDTLRFFKIGFLLMKELFFEICDDELFVSDVIGRDCAGLRGPYSHVTSDSLSLDHHVSYSCRILRGISSYQLSVSGEIVRNRYFDLAHVLHDAFSNRDFCPYTLLCETICLHEAQISSSLQLWLR